MIVDVESDERRLLFVAPGAVISACGLAVDDRRLLCAYTSDQKCAIAVFDRSEDYRLVDTIVLPTIRDIHSIVLDGEGVIVAATGTDEIVRCDDSGRGEVLWRAAPGGGDTHHINSLARVDGRLCCTAFGLRDGASWDDAVDGYAYDIEAGRRIAGGLYQPHSLVSSGELAYLCDSARSALRTTASDIRFFDGYVRGLAIHDDGRYFVGTSIGRRVPRTLSTVGNAAFAGEPAGRCGIEMGRLDTVRPGARIAFDGVASEIYDVVLIG